ncbi:hypothetical protein CC78DRAFT_574177 [Lojkania enalia]|uniref:Uncharacterized protein n=1 Tax=Lojkania enalia TaxID=147567 RepID=A0A9P4NBA3_9PLEO|nr:hypothetical protein CC78DRAFT_574177 [Didymosphaeria enalia]
MAMAAWCSGPGGPPQSGNPLGVTTLNFDDHPPSPSPHPPPPERLPPSGDTETTSGRGAGAGQRRGQRDSETAYLRRRPSTWSRDGCVTGVIAPLQYGTLLSGWRGYSAESGQQQRLASFAELQLRTSVPQSPCP